MHHLQFEDILRTKAAALYPSSADPSHDVLHVARVVAAAKKLAVAEGADLDIVVPAAWLHDMVNVPKNDPRRKMASRLSADAAVEYLAAAGYPAKYADAIHHAIAAHSFSANIPAETIEAKVVQDADRLDGLGAVGVARCFVVNGKMGTPFYNDADFMAETRAADDRLYAIDHFFVKLFKTAESLHTEAARAEGRRRVAFMKEYLLHMRREALEGLAA